MYLDKYSNSISVLTLKSLTIEEDKHDVRRLNNSLDKLSSILQTNTIKSSRIIDVLKHNLVPEYIYAKTTSNGEIVENTDIATLHYNIDICKLLYVTVKLYIYGNAKVIQTLHNAYSITQEQYAEWLEDDNIIIKDIDDSNSLIDKQDIAYESGKYYNVTTSIYSLYKLNIPYDDIKYQELDLDNYIYIVLDIPKIYNDAINYFNNVEYINTIHEDKRDQLPMGFIDLVLTKDINTIDNNFIRKFVYDIQQYIKSMTGIPTMYYIYNKTIFNYLKRNWTNLPIDELIKEFPYIFTINNIIKTEFNKFLIFGRKDRVLVNTNVSNSILYHNDIKTLLEKVNEKITTE